MRNQMNNLPIFIVTFFIIGLVSCIDKYDFSIQNEKRGVVIESFISDKSFSDSKTYPSEGRYFFVKVSYTGNVTNEKPVFVKDAIVKLYSDDNMEIDFVTSQNKPGYYYLLSDDFKAISGRKYQLICTIGSEQFHSEWVSLPKVNQPLGRIGITEEVKQEYIVNGVGEKVITNNDIINLFLDIPENSSKDDIFYIWNFDPLWTYTAPKPRSDSPVKKCWVTSQFYLSNQTTLMDNVGGYKHKLASVQTQHNNKTYDYFSLLITQSIVNKDYYYFYKDLEEQSNKGGLFDQLPYNLATNFSSSNENIKVYGYFSIHHEAATRWVLNHSDLSYEINNDIKVICDISYGPPAPGDIDPCEDCRGYVGGIAVNYPPSWW